MVALRRDAKNNEYDAIYKYKKLLDDGIITQVDYDQKKAEFLNSIEKK